jgi:hypothetical protein
LAGGYLFKSAHGLHYHFEHISHSSFSISVPPTFHSSPLCLLTRTELITGDTSYRSRPVFPSSESTSCSSKSTSCSSEPTSRSSPCSLFLLFNFQLPLGSTQTMYSYSLPMMPLTSAENCK